MSVAKEFKSVVSKVSSLEDAEAMIIAVEEAAHNRHEQLVNRTDEIVERLSRVEENMLSMSLSVTNIEKILRNKFTLDTDTSSKKSQTSSRMSKSHQGMISPDHKKKSSSNLRSHISDSDSDLSKISSTYSRNYSASDESIISKVKESYDENQRSTRRVDAEKRRETIFSVPKKSIKTSKSVKAGTSSLMIVKAITRENFPNVELRSLDLEHICAFLDEYDRILQRHPDQGFKMFDFIHSKLHAKLTISAVELEYVTSTTFGLGISSLSDRRLKKCILHMVRAISPEDYIKKMRSISFPGRGDGFEPSAMNFNLLFDRATVFGHRFSRILHMITERARDLDIPPLYKEGKTLGIIDYFLAAWPGNTGNKLYAKLSINHPSLRNKSDFASFLHKFFKVLKPYKDIRDGLMGLDSILNTAVRKPAEHNKSTSVMYPANETQVSSRILNVYSDPEYDDIYPDASNDLGISENTSYDDRNNHYEPDVHLDVSAELESDPKTLSSSVVPCKRMYECGECKDRDCKALHDRDAMTRFQDKILKNLVKSQFVDSEDAFLEKARKLFSLKRNTEMYES